MQTTKSILETMDTEVVKCAFDIYRENTMRDEIDQKLYDLVSSNTNIVTGEDYRRLVSTVSQVATDMIIHTLGPYGSTTLIDDGSISAYPTKDGWSCLSRLVFSDPTYNIILNMLKGIAFNSANTVGDGTTTATTIANSFLKEVRKLMDSNTEEKFRQADFINSMEYIANRIEKELLSNKNIHLVNTDTYDDIYKVAHIATNGNDEISKMIQEIYKETNNPYIQVSIDKAPETYHTIESGYKFPARVINYPSYINSDSGNITYDNTVKNMIIFDHSLNYQTHGQIISGISSYASTLGKDIIICAPNFDSLITSAIDTVVKQMVQNGQVPNIMLVQVPTITELHKVTLADMSILINASIMDEAKVRAFNVLYHNSVSEPDKRIEDSIFELPDYKFNAPSEVIERCLGTIKSITFSKTEGYIRDYKDIMDQNKFLMTYDEAERNFKLAKEQSNKTIGATLDKDYLFMQSRYIKLTGKTGHIHIGGISEVKQRCDRDTIDDAVLACKSAFEHGYVRGLNLELLSVIYNSLLREYRLFGSLIEVDENNLNKTVNIPYGSEICHLLFNAVLDTTLYVLNNKRSADTKFSAQIISGELTAIVDFNNLDLIKHLIDFDTLDYNLITDTLNTYNKEEGWNEWTVINSTQTDIVILKAVVNMLTLLITSNQFLSTTERLNKAFNGEKQFQDRLTDDYRITSNRVNASIETLKSAGVDLANIKVGL